MRISALRSVAGDTMSNNAIKHMNYKIITNADSIIEN